MRSFFRIRPGRLGSFRLNSSGPELFRGGSGFRVLGFRVLGFRVLGFRVLGFRVLGFRVLGFKVLGFWV